MAARKLRIPKSSLTQQIEACKKSRNNRIKEAAKSLMILRDNYFEPKHYNNDFVFTASNGKSKLIQFAPQMLEVIEKIEICLSENNVRQALTEIKGFKKDLNE